MNTLHLLLPLPVALRPLPGGRPPGDAFTLHFRRQALRLVCMVSWLLVGLALPDACPAANPRTITFVNDVGNDVDDFHIEFKGPVSLRASNTVVLPPGVRGNKDFQYDRPANRGTGQHLYSGLVSGDTNPDTEPSSLKIRVYSDDGSPIRIERWWWTVGGDPISDGGRSGLLYLGDAGGVEVRFGAVPATGDGRIEVRIGGHGAVFTNSANATAREAAAAFVAFLSRFTQDGEPLIDVDVSEDGTTVNLGGNLQGDSKSELKVTLLQPDRTQDWRIQDKIHLHVADGNQDNRIDIHEVTALASRWRGGQFDDIDAVSRAAAIWRHGEVYHYDAGNVGQLRYSIEPVIRTSDSRIVYPASVLGAVQLTAPDVNVWGEDWDGDGKDDHIFIDEDGDGNPDRALIDMDEDGKFEVQHVDQDDDGDWDTTARNDDDDGDWDSAKTDANRDGTYDWQWTDDNGNGERDAGEVRPIEPEPVPVPPRPRSQRPYDPTRWAYSRMVFLNGPVPNLRAAAIEPVRSWPEDWDGDGKPDHHFFDDDVDGNPDRVYVDQDEDGNAEEVWWDQDDDGVWDGTLWDDNDDGRLDRGSIDTDRDGQYDSEWTDRNGDGAVQEDEVERIEPKPMPAGPRPRTP